MINTIQLTMFAEVKNGGLLDENNIKKYLNTRSLSIIIVNETPPNDDPNSYSTPEAVTTNKKFARIG